MKFFVALLACLIKLVIVTNAGVSMHNPFFCYMTDRIRASTSRHSGFTSYEAFRRFNFTPIDPKISTCTPSRFWYQGRHGSQYSVLTTMQAMIALAESSLQADIVANYNAGRTTLCRQDFESIRDWTLPAYFTLGQANLATPAAVIAMQNIARRYQQIFPNLLNGTYSPNQFYFRHDYNERTNTSIRGFASGLFGESGSQNVIYEDVPDNDWFLRPFDFCPEYTEGAVYDNVFRRGPEFDEMLLEINRKLGFHGSNQLNYDGIFDMERWCVFDTSSQFDLSNSPIGPDSAWCAPFSVANTAVIEYQEDLARIHAVAYGFPNQRLLENLHCGLMQDLLNHMQSNDSTDPIARIFVSSEVIQPMLVLLGALRPTFPLHEHNYAQQSDREWLTSRIGSFANHLAVVRFDCDDGDHELVFILNESPLLVPGCDPHSGLCKLSFIVNKFQRFIDVDCESFFCTDN